MSGQDLTPAEQALKDQQQQPQQQDLLDLTGGEVEDLTSPPLTGRAAELAAQIQQIATDHVAEQPQEDIPEPQMPPQFLGADVPVKGLGGVTFCCTINEG